MKSKKIVAMIVALASFMAFATSGFAAVNTTTTYNTESGKVEVDVNVTGATEGSEVTYLVKNSSETIVYIDQKNAADGSVDFSYKIAKDKIRDLETTVQFGTNGANAITGEDEDIQLKGISVNVENATVAYYKDAACVNAFTANETVAVGDKDTDKVYVKVTPNSGYEIESATLADQDAGDAGIYAVGYGDTLTVSTKSSYTPPSIQDIVPGTVTGEDYTEVIESGKVEEEDTFVIKENGWTYTIENAEAVTKILKVTGVPTEIGVEVEGVKYKAVPGEGGYKDGELYAVRILVDKGTTISMQSYID